MLWNSCFIVSIVVLVVSLLHAARVIKTYKSGRILTPFNTIFVGVFLAVFIGMIPMFCEMLENETGFFLKLSMFNFLQTIQVFTINVGADLILENISVAATSISGMYSTYMTCLFFVAPILTFGFLASLFKDVLAELMFKLQYWKDAYIFSELNEQALILAQSIKEKHPNSLIVFTDCDRDEEDIVTEYIESAKEMKAIILKKDIVATNFMMHSNKSQIVFLTIGDKEGENLIYSLKLLEKYHQRKNTSLYVFSTGAEGELLLANAKKGEIKVRRVNEVRSLIYNFLYHEGERIFESAYNGEENKEINAIVVGLGQYGTEMLKALTWYSQMDGYSINIHAFDQDELAYEKFAALCPEIMSSKYNGVHIPGESEYTIHIHSMDVRTKTFADYMAQLDKTTFVFVALGDDAMNINQSANIRMLCARSGCSPIIKTVVYSTEEKDALVGIKNYRGQEYGIEAIGDFESTYSEEILLGSELEKLALERHLKWGQEEEFWQYEYNYRSSMASAVHMKARIACGIMGADKAEKDLTLEERDTIEVLEHRRWNTYMRCEGYVYSGSHDKSSRNDLAKMHHDLVDFDSLSEEDKRKDSSVGAK